MAERQQTRNPGNFAEDRERASRAGHTGGQQSSGNFANNPERAAAAGRKGGQASHGGTGRSHAQSAATASHSRSGSHEGDASQAPGNFAEDREKASAAGRKGGHSSHRS